MNEQDPAKKMIEDFDLKGQEIGPVTRTGSPEVEESNYDDVEAEGNDEDDDEDEDEEICVDCGESLDDCDCEEDEDDDEESEF